MAAPMETAILKLCVGPFGIAARIKKIAILQNAVDKYTFIQDETFIVVILALIHLYAFSAHMASANFLDSQ
jgi:hypothetical protein